MKDQLTVQTTVAVDVQTTFDVYTNPKHIVHWNFASPEWHCPHAEVDLHVGGKYLARMEAKDSSMGFDFGATFEEVSPSERVTYRIADGRKVVTTFAKENDRTIVTTVFEPENIHAQEMQQVGWQAILDNFNQYIQTTFNP